MLIINDARGQQAKNIPAISSYIQLYGWVITIQKQKKNGWMNISTAQLVVIGGIGSQPEVQGFDQKQKSISMSLLRAKWLEERRCDRTIDPYRTIVLIGDNFLLRSAARVMAG